MDAHAVRAWHSTSRAAAPVQSPALGRGRLDEGGAGVRPALRDLRSGDVDELRALRERIESQRQQQIAKEGKIEAQHRMHLSRMQQLQHDVSMRAKEIERSARDDVRRAEKQRGLR